MTTQQKIRKAEDLAKSIREALDAFKQICRKENKPSSPCENCPLWLTCGTLPGSIDDDTITDVAVRASEYLMEKETAADENSVPVQS